MPQTAKLVDELRMVFPKIKVLYAEEGPYRVGKKPDPSKYVVPNIGYLSDKPTEKKGRKK